MALQKGAALQDPFLNILRKERIPVSIYLVNGIKFKARLNHLIRLLCCCGIQ